MAMDRDRDRDRHRGSAIQDDYTGHGSEASMEELAYRLRQQQIMTRFGLIALNGHEIQELLDTAVALCAEGLQTGFAKIAQYDPASNTLTARAGIGWREGVVGSSILTADLDNPAGYALHTREPVISDHMTDTSKFRTPHVLAEHGIRRAINVVIDGFGQPFGVLEADSTSTDRFTGADVVFLQGMSTLLTVALDRRRAEETLRESEKRLRFLAELEEVTRDLNDPREIMKITTRLTAEKMSATRCAYADVEPDGDRFTIRADYAAGDAESTVGTYRLASFGSKAVSELTNRRNLIIHDVDRELPAADGGDTFRTLGIRSIICCPLIKRGRLHAMFALHQATPRVWTPWEIRLVEIVATRCWSYIERVRYEAKLLEADRHKDEFLAVLAHELRNPLAPVRNALSVLQSDAAAPHVKRQAGALMGRQVDLLVRLVDDLMDISRISQGKIELRRQPLHLQEVIRNAIETARPVIEDRKHALKLDLPEEEIFVDGDFVRLSQVFSNLLTNAGKYTPHGGTITVAAEPGAQAVAVRITDNGIGIDPVLLPRIFELFQQAEKTRSHSQGGLGIGLSVVKRLVEMHGGTVEAQSAGADKGSTFVVRLPVIQPGDAASPAEARMPAPVAPPRRVLLVDGNEASAKAFSWLLDLMHQETRVAHSAADALEKAAAFRPEIVIIDLGLHDGGGLDLCRTMKKDSAFRNTLFIALSAWSQEEHRQQAIEAGFDYFYFKPVGQREISRHFR